MGKRLVVGALRTLESIHRKGVVHKDVRGANMLYNPETNRVMMIDFERSLLVQPSRCALAPLVPNKRAWSRESSGKRAVRDLTSDRHQIEDDILMAKSAFLEPNWYAVT